MKLNNTTGNQNQQIAEVEKRAGSNPDILNLLAIIESLDAELTKAQGKIEDLEYEVRCARGEE